MYIYIFVYVYVHMSTYVCAYMSAYLYLSLKRDCSLFKFSLEYDLVFNSNWTNI